MLGLVAISVLALVSTAAVDREIPVPSNGSFAADWDRVHFDHGLLDAALREHVDGEGLVDYAALGNDARFQEYLYRLANTDPVGLANDKARLAFWINAYNTLVIQGVLKELPQERSAWPRFNVLDVRVPGYLLPGKGFFRGLRFEVGKRRYALDEIEHGVLLQRDGWVRKNPEWYRSIGVGKPDPRIHFALVCAAKGCVKLRRGAYTADAVDEQLDEAVGRFVQGESQLRFDPRHRVMYASKLLDWYGRDLTNPEFARHAKSVPAFFADYVESPKLARSLREQSWTVKWIEYDWSLNVQP